MTTTEEESLTVNIVLTFFPPRSYRGGLELLFAKKQKLKFSLPKIFGEPSTS
jgi:hypothetical protein